MNDPKFRQLSLINDLSHKLQKKSESRAINKKPDTRDAVSWHKLFLFASNDINCGLR